VNFRTNLDGWQKFDNFTQNNYEFDENGTGWTQLHKKFKANSKFGKKTENQPLRLPECETKQSFHIIARAGFEPENARKRGDVVWTVLGLGNVGLDVFDNGSDKKFQAIGVHESLSKSWYRAICEAQIVTCTKIEIETTSENLRVQKKSMELPMRNHVFLSESCEWNMWPSFL
jgi:hypothetical protein